MTLVKNKWQLKIRCMHYNPLVKLETTATLYSEVGYRQSLLCVHPAFLSCPRRVRTHPWLLVSFTPHLDFCFSLCHFTTIEDQAQGT